MAEKKILVCLYFVCSTKRQAWCIEMCVGIDLLFRKTAMHLDADLPPAKSKTKMKVVNKRTHLTIQKEVIQTQINIASPAFLKRRQIKI